MKTVTIKLDIQQWVKKSDTKDCDEFDDLFCDPDPAFEEDYLGSLEVSDLKQEFNLKKIELDGSRHFREIEFVLVFKTKNIDEFYKLMEDEYIYEDEEFDSNRFAVYWMSGLNSIWYEDDSEAEHEIEIDETDVFGEINIQ